MFVELSSLDQELLLSSSWTKTPLSGVSVTVHDDTLEFAHESMIAGHDLMSGHLSNGQSDGLTLGGDQDALCTDFDA